MEGGDQRDPKNLLFAQNQKINDADGFLDDDQQWAWWNCKLTYNLFVRFANKICISKCIFLVRKIYLSKLINIFDDEDDFGW